MSTGPSWARSCLYRLERMVFTIQLIVRVWMLQMPKHDVPLVETFTCMQHCKLSLIMFLWPEAAELIPAKDLFMDTLSWRAVVENITRILHRAKTSQEGHSRYQWVLEGTNAGNPSDFFPWTLSSRAEISWTSLGGRQLEFEQDLWYPITLLGLFQGNLRHLQSDRHHTSEKLTHSLKTAVTLW